MVFSCCLGADLCFAKEMEDNQMTNNDNTRPNSYHIHIHYTVGEGKDTVIIDEEVPVSEEVFRAYVRPIQAEKKRKERASRCSVGNGNGKTKRCTGNCSECEYFRSGTALSLERLEEETGHDISEATSDIADIAIYNELLQKLFLVLDELDPQSRRICESIMDGKMDKDIAEELGYAARTTFSSQKYKLFKELRERLKDYR